MASGGSMVCAGKCVVLGALVKQVLNAAESSVFVRQNVAALKGRQQVCTNKEVKWCSASMLYYELAVENPSLLSTQTDHCGYGIIEIDILTAYPRPVAHGNPIIPEMESPCRLTLRIYPQ
ncbi:hypothetical protein NPIL_628421 [Nephila pilipes]|uniref:Uncharacterized protein n=1 Tax=Nephila pilipes TaxID=299642 RepID=A0A8X6QNX8_NEPPI|nr:hypothetical protein NPIL_628421 [Nephila pilipes]